MFRSQSTRFPKTTLITVSRTTRVLLAAAVFTCLAYNAGAQFGGLSDGGKHGASINIQIYAANGALIDLPAQATLSSPVGMSSLEQTVSNDGVVLFSGLSPGSYSVTVHVVGFEDAREQVEVAGDGIAEAAIELEPEGNPTTQADAMGFVLAPKAKKDLDLGLAAIHASKFLEAQQHLDAAYKLAPGDPNVSAAMAELYLATNDLPKAQQFVEHATSIDPDNLNALIDAGQLRILQKNFAGAQPPLEHALDVSPRSKFAHWLLGITYLDLGLYEKAKEEATEVVKINKSAATDGKFLLGEALAGLGRTTEAIATLKTFVKKAPRDSYTPYAENLIAKLQSQPTPQASQNSGDQVVASTSGTKTQ